MQKENDFRQYDNSLTQIVENNNTYIIKQLKTMIRKGNYRNLLEYLNDETNLITPAYLLKRQIQQVYPQILDQAAEEMCVDILILTEAENVLWTDDENQEMKLIARLAELLPSVVWEETSTKWSHFEKYLLETLPTKRNVILSLAAAFQMDEITLTKFLLSCSKHELSVRNPLDYIYLYCLKAYSDQPVQWKKVEELLKRYETAVQKKRSGDSTNIPAEDSKGNSEDRYWTVLLQNNLAEISGENKPEYEKKTLNTEDELIEFMAANSDKFTSVLYREKKNSKGEKVIAKKGQYLEGFSLTHKKYLKEVARILVKLYPTYQVIHSTKNHAGSFQSVDVEKNQDGYPNLSQLVKSMVFAHGWDFSADSSIEDSRTIKTYLHKDGQIGIPRSHKKLIYDSMPFRKYVYLYCKGFNAKIRMAENIDTDHKNVEPIERQDILYLAYMFLSGFTMLTPEDQENFCDTVEEAYGDNPVIQKLIHIMELLMDICDDAVDVYQNCLNLFLSMFDFGELYLPFVFDRFVLLALLGERESKDITWTMELMEAGYWDDIDELGEE